MITPYSWQLPAIAKTTEALRTGKIFVNASDTGVGKTICALKTAEELQCKFLVIAPKAVHTAWQRTAEAMNVSGQLLGIINPEKLRFKNPWCVDGQWQLPPDTLVIWDEVHRGASGPKTKTAGYLAALKAYPVSVLALSATVADSPVKLRGLGYLLGLHQFNLPSFNRWCLDHGCFRMPMREQLQFTKGPRARKVMDAIRTQIADKLVRLRIQDIPDFPENQILVELFNLEDKYTDELNKIYENMSIELTRTPSIMMVARLRARQKAELLKVPLLRDLAIETIEADCAPVLFVNFRDTVQALRTELAAAGHEFGIIIGDQKDRQSHVDAFQANKTPGIIATADSGGLGISLHDVHGTRPRRSFITPNDNSVTMKQVLGRIHRTGGTKAVQTFVLIAGTIEEKVYENVKRKTGNIDSLNDGDLEV